MFAGVLAWGSGQAEVLGTLAWPKEWVVFLPLPREAPVLPKAVLNSVPERLEVAGKTIPARRVKPEGGTRLDFAPLFGGVKADNTAYAFLALESDKARKVTLGMGADWFLQAWLNGEKIKDTMDDGNVEWPPSIFNLPTTVELKAGRNILAVRFVSGSGSSVLALGGPDQLRAPPLPPLPPTPTAPVEWRQAKAKDAKTIREIVPNGDFEQGGGGDPFIPAGWSNGAGKDAFQPGELKLDTNAPLAGNKAALEINTLGAGPGKHKLHARLDVDVNNLYEISFGFKHLAGDYTSVSVRNEPSGSDTSFIQAIGDVKIKKGGYDSTKVKDSGGQGQYKGTYYFDKPHPYLVIQTHGASHALVDDISIKPLVGSKRAYDSYQEQHTTWKVDWQTLSGEVKTPHTLWAKPYAMDELKIVTIMPRFLQRWAVELAQRFNVSCQPVMMPRVDLSKFENDYWVCGPDGEPELFMPQQDALEKLAAGKDCIVLVRGHGPLVNETLSDAVLKQVEAGAGLVVFDLSAQELLPKDKESRWTKALAKQNRVEKEANYPALGPVVGADEAFYKYGKGRIALIKRIPVAGADADSRGEFEMQMSYMMKAMLWASGKLPSPRLAGFELPGAAAGGLMGKVRRTALPAPMKVFFSAPLPQGGDLSWWLDDYKGQTTPGGGEVKLEAGQKEARIDVPRLCNGTHWLHLQLKAKDGKIVDWSTVCLDVAGDLAISSIEFGPGALPYYTAGDAISGKVTLSAPPGDGYRLRLRLKDVDGHLWSEKDIAAKGKETGFSLTADKAFVLMHTLEAELVGPDGVADVAARDVAVTRSPDWYDNLYDFQLWHVPGVVENRLRYLSALVAAEIRKTGVNSDYNGNARINAYNNIRCRPGVGRLEPGHSQAKLAGDKLHAPEREPCLNDPAFRQKVKDGELAKSWETGSIEKRDLPNTLPYAPFAYELGSEANLLGFGSIQGKADADVCFCPHCLASFRSFLRKEYGTLEALNKAWGTSFQAWDGVRPIVLADAVKEGQAARWIDHRRHMDWVFADFWKYKLDVVRKHDPAALAVGDNLREPTSFSGVDYWLLFNGVIGGSGLPVPYLRSFVPPERERLTCVRYSYWNPNIVTPDSELFRERIGTYIWNSLFQGMHGSSYYTELFLSGPDGYCPPIMMPDLRMTEYNRWSTEAIAQIRTGIERLVFESKRDDSGIAMLYSRSSEHAATAWQKIQGGDVAEKLSAAGQVLFFARTLSLLGYQYSAVSEQQVANGDLKDRGIKLLILPFSQAIDTKAVSRIREFVSEGGIVLADIRPAVGDSHGSLAERGQLDDVFGVTHDTKWTSYIPEKGETEIGGKLDGLTIEKASLPVICGQKITLSGAVKLCQAKGKPMLTYNRFGSGKALLLNFTPLVVDTTVLDVFGKLMKWLGLNPQFNLKSLEAHNPGESESKTPVIPVEEQVGSEEGEFADAEGFMGASGMAAPARPTLAHYVNGGIHLFSFWCSNLDRRRGAGTERLRVTPPRAGHIYDLKSNEYLGERGSFEVVAPLEGFNVYASVPYRVEKPRLEISEKLTAAGNAQLSCRVRVAPDEAAKERHVVRLKLFAPDGGEWSDFADNIVTREGVGTHEFILPLNAPHGKWKVEAREAISGLVASGSVQIE